MSEKEYINKMLSELAVLLGKDKEELGSYEEYQEHFSNLKTEEKE